MLQKHEDWAAEAPEKDEEMGCFWTLGVVSVIITVVLLFTLWAVNR